MSAAGFQHPPRVKTGRAYLPTGWREDDAQLFPCSNEGNGVSVRLFCRAGRPRPGVAYDRGTRGERNSPRSAPPRVSRPITPTTGTWTTVPPLVRTEAFELGLAQLPA